MEYRGKKGGEGEERRGGEGDECTEQFPANFSQLCFPHHFGGRLLPGDTSVQHIDTHSQLARGGHPDHCLPPPHQFGIGKGREGGTWGRRGTHHTSSTTTTLRLPRGVHITRLAVCVCVCVVSHCRLTIIKQCTRGDSKLTFLREVV